MTPILLNYDQPTHDIELGFANQDLAKYNTLLAAIATEIPALTLDIAGFTSLLNNPQLYAFEYIVGGPTLIVGGITYNQQQAMQMVQIPAAWLIVINLVNAFNADFQTNTVYKYRSIQTDERLVNRLSISNIAIVSNVFVLTTAYTTALTAKYSIYTTSDKQNSIYAALDTIFTTCQTLKTLGASFTADKTLRDLGVFDNLDGVTLTFNATGFVTQN